VRTLPCVAAFLVRDTQREITPACPTEDTVAIQDAIAYVIEPYGDLTEKNGAPSLRTQNQAVDFILAYPAARDAVARWAWPAEIEEATTGSPRPDALRRRLPAYTSQSRIRDAAAGLHTGRPGGG